MQINDILHGFQVRQIRELPELRARLVRMEYLKNGADLVWLDREDDNKTFAITFKTIPQDDTGVFHILEHSVLCGSEKYPVKEPFVELLKSSMNTFLNAFTFPDKTMYPVCSRNGQDFLNLIDVYLDATLHPLSVSGPHAFRQEGWHYELEAPEGELTVNGVVYNEMKGAYASPDSVAMSEINRLLFPDNCYGFESGGHPAHIPELTYENYLASHRRFYHPSNSRIFLDGSIDTGAVLAKLDSYLSAYDRIEPDSDIPMQAPVAPPEACVPYAVGPEEDEAGKSLYAQGWVVGRFDETEKLQGFAALADVLCGSNDAPLKKALLERGLAADVELITIDGVQQPYTMLLLRNCADGKEAEIRQCIRGVLEELAEKGLDHEQLKAKLDRMEFAAREKDFGSMPKGLAFAILAQQGWLYGGDPAQDLRVFEVFPALREKVDQGWFEALLRELLLDNPHQAALRLLPSKTLAAENQSREAARLKALKESWTPEQVRDTIDAFVRFRELQGTPDTPEQKASLPLLSLSDIPEEPRQLRQAVEKAGDVTVLHQDLETDGIVYLDLYFSLADMPAETLAPLSFLTRLLGKLGTEHFGALELSAKIDRTLGAFRAGATVVGKKESPAVCEPMLTVSLSVLESKKDEALALLDEILNRSVYTDAAQIANLLRQQRLEKEQTVTMSGNAFAVMRVGAAFTAAGAVNEQLSGISYLRWLQEQDKRLAGGDSGLCAELTGLSGKLFHSSRLTVSVTGALDRAWVDSLLALFPAAPMGAPAAYALAPVSREGFQIPAEIGFAAKATHLSRVSGVKDGVWQVASQFLTYDYLWNEVRVKGGAYGTGFRVSRGGDLSLHSFRDPSPAQSLVTFDGAAEALRGLCSGGEDLTKYIISTVARQDPVLSARAEGSLSATLYLRGEGAEDRRRLHSEILHTTPEQLLQAADALDALKDQFGVCVIGGQKVLEACAGALEKVEALQ